ncbi:MAG: type II toxin-antitoxin system YafQ family toxin [Phascolarctobacterium sp.]|nr:type II toxin-antitoxin system YafQ family toxin [Phascolarctobacterium sp.]MBR6511107.1 type II toxin-antitoxin system YafQ family toxin [Phascolarctobacterium sp.]
MYDIVPSNKFKKDLKLAKSRGYDIELLTTVIEMLAEGKELPVKYRDHALVSSRDYKNKRECHILPDWLLIYEICDNELILYLTRTGTHSDLFK